MENLKKENRLVIEAHKSYHYPPRTAYNISNSDVTIQIAVDFNTAGERLTTEIAKEKSFFVVLKSLPIVSAKNVSKVLPPTATKINIAGNSIHTLEKHSISQLSVNIYLFHFLQELVRRRKILLVRSGGQTGIDWAGAVAAHALGIPVALMFPKHFRQRNFLGIDTHSTEEEIRNRLLDESRYLFVSLGCI
jgi:hypothetical protein